MASNDSMAKIDQRVKNLDRTQLLAFLGVDDLFEQVSDFEVIHPISTSTVNPIVIYKTDVSFLNKINMDLLLLWIVDRLFDVLKT